MHSLHLLLGIAFGLCIFMPPLVQGRCLELNNNDMDELLFYHNAVRSNVNPRAANMRQMVWSDDLANIAARNACRCNFQYTDLPPIPYKHHHARENHIYYPANNLGSMVAYWYQEHVDYNFIHGQCYEDSICEHYLNMVWARACEVGCALSVCRPEEIYDPQIEVPNGQGGGTLDFLFMLVCVYGAGFPGDATLDNYRPYRAGQPCSECPEYRFPLCLDEAASPASQQLTFGAGGPGPVPHVQLPFLCYNEEEACIGSDPHFAIRLSGGALLCYTFQGQTNTIFNLVSNNQVQMNALFVADDTDYENTWLGSIGITVSHDGKKMTTLQFTAADRLVRIGERVELEAKTIKKLSFHSGKLSMLEVPSNHTPRYPRVQVEFVDTGLEFTIKFTKSNHLDLYWHNIRVLSKKSGGVVGQFFRDGVRIDEDAHVLRMPGRPPVPVEEQDLWKFTKQSFQNDSKCWTSAYHSSQGAGIVAGTYQDYIVEDLLSVVQ